MAWPWWAVLVASLPIVALAAVLLGAWSLSRVAWAAAALAAALAITVFGLDVVEVARAAGRGVWTGGWILLIVLPALLLFEVLDRSGALDRLAGAVDEVAPTEGRRLLLLAWVMPSFLQGAAGFGAPIAMSAPLLVRRGMPPVAAVAACLVGYQWSVTFGSMGAAYFVAEATARLGEADARAFALRSAVILAVTAVASGLLVLGRGRRSPGDRRRALVIGVVMGLVLIAAVAVQPALGTILAGLAGLATCWWLLPGPGARRPHGRDLAFAALPYLVLAGAAALAFGVPPVRGLLERLPVLAPTLPGTDAAFGHTTPDGTLTPVFRPLLHPLPYLLLAIVVAWIAYRRRGWWPQRGGRDALASWRLRSGTVATSILGLMVLAAVLIEAGMIAALAGAATGGLGPAFVGLSAPLGLLGTLLTGSTTGSNALLSSLQAEVAIGLAIAPAILLAGQTAGGNLGNTISPAIAAVGISSAGGRGLEGAVLRRNLRDLAILVVLVVALVTGQTLLA